MAVHAAVLLLLLSLVAFGEPRAHGTRQGAPAANPDTFALEAHVVGRDGTPIPGLTLDQFEVLVDGKPRSVASADFRQSAAGGDAAARYAGGRVIVLAIDQPSFPPSARAGVAEAANRVVAGVAPADYLGVVAFPGSVAPTRDREAARTLLQKIAGGRGDIATPRFQISAADALLLRSGDAVAIQTIVTRECDFAFNPTCRNEVLQDGSAIAEVLEQQNRLSLTALFATIDALGSLPGRKTMILLSAGLPMTIRPGTRPDQHADIARLAQAAAAANVQLHVLYLNGKFLRHFSPEYRKRHYAIFDDLRTFGASLESFAQASGGSFRQMDAEREASVDRLLVESSAYYSLAIRTLPEDRNGAEHLIRVSVKHRGATVRHRGVVRIPQAP